jgi:hypothetical protein
MAWMKFDFPEPLGPMSTFSGRSSTGSKSGPNDKNRLGRRVRSSMGLGRTYSTIGDASTSAH